MTTGNDCTADAPKCHCLCESLGIFLARHPKMHRSFVRLGRTRIARNVLGCMARSVLSRLRKKPLDDAWIAEAESCPLPEPHGDPEDLFLASISDNVEGRRQMAQFLGNLDGLDRGLRSGLVRTWLHACLFTGATRRAEYLRDQANGTWRCRPMDAILAPFGRCNLRCRGCFYQDELHADPPNLTSLLGLVDQLQDANVYHILVVGKGEPFFDEHSREILFAIAKNYPNIFFSVYTNGTTLQDQDLLEIKQHPNLIPILSIDGPKPINDWRRGEGVHDKVVETMLRMREQKMLFGFISTVFRDNQSAVLDSAFIGQMADLGCRFGYYSLFVTPPDGSCHEMMLDSSMREQYFQRFKDVNAAAPIPLIDIDGIEAGFGCRAKHGMTVYIDGITGAVSPCIRVPLSSPSCNAYKNPHPARLAEIMASEEFSEFRSRPTFGHCEAFHHAEKLCGRKVLLSAESVAG